ncbi:MAG: HAMP domain-containing protein [Fimbriimonadaceae bacterium]|nr:HAMP domain-containing protein [Fimbriimonadaceae bacterium]
MTAPWRSFRGRLTLLNAAVIVVTLVAFGFALAAGARSALMRALDDDLRDRGRRFALGGQGPGPGMGMGMGPWFRGGQSQGAGAGQGPGRGRGWGPGGPEPGFRGGEPNSGAPESGPPPRDGGENPERAPRLGDGPAPGPLAFTLTYPLLQAMPFLSPGPIPSSGPPPLPFNGPGPRDVPWFRRATFFLPNGAAPGLDGRSVLDEAGFRRAMNGEEAFGEVVREEGTLRVFSTPVVRDRRVEGVVQVASELDAYRGFWESQLAVLGLLVPVALLVGSLGGLFLANRALRPVQQVTQAAAELSDQDLSKRLDVRGDDELAAMARTFNAMLDRLAAAFGSRDEAYRRLSDAFEQQRRFTADASHELRTPLARLKLTTSLALSGEDGAKELREALEVADQSADAMTQLVQQLLLLARTDAEVPTQDREPVDLADATSEAIEVVGAEVAFDAPASPICALAERHAVVRVLVNLIENASLHGAGGAISVAIREEDDRAVVEVRDQGPGIPAVHLPRLTERFYRVDAARSRADGGTGLGLAIVRSLVESYGGTIEIASEVGVGTVVTVRWPVATVRP